MMQWKWVFAALLLANIGLWMWGSWHRDTFEDETATADEATRAELAPEKMRLLSEPGVHLLPRKAPPLGATEPTQTPAPLPVGQRCWRIGPFADPAQASQAGVKLDERKLGFTRRIEGQKTVSGYRVQLPSLASKGAVENKRKELTRLGFKDHTVIQREAWQNTISLGLFSAELNAENRVRELTAKGVEATVQPLYQTQTRYWLEIAPGVPAETANQLKQVDWGATPVQVTETACPAATAPAPPAEALDNAPT